MRVIAYWTFACLAAVMLGIIVHELGHFLAAVAVKWPVHGIGRGTTPLSFAIVITPPVVSAEKVRVARQKCRGIASAGPAANLIVGVLFWWSGPAFHSHVRLSNSRAGFVIALGAVQLALGISNRSPAKEDQSSVTTATSSFEFVAATRLTSAQLNFSRQKLPPLLAPRNRRSEGRRT